MAEPTGVTTTSVEDDADTADVAGGEFGAEVPSEYTTETAQDSPARAVTRRPVVTGNAAGTGRRKEAIARVRIAPGTGQWLINGRTLDVYFPNKVHQQLVNEPFVTLGAEGKFDVIARISGGGVTGQAGALRLGVTRSLILVDPESRPTLKKAGFADQGPPGQGAQEVRPEEGPEGTAVLQAITAARAELAGGTRQRTRAQPRRWAEQRAERNG